MSSTAQTGKKSKVFLFGATGHLGSEILHELTSAPYAKHFQVSALVRTDTFEAKDEEKKVAALSKLKASGAHLVIGDVQVSEAAEIAKWIAGHDIVISALSAFLPGRAVDLKLLEAVKLVQVPWFIPNFFSSDFTKAFADSLPPMAKKKAVVEAVKASGVNYFIVICYIFAEYLTSPLLGVDIGNDTVTAPYSMQAKASTITVPDIAKLTVEALLQRNETHVKNQMLHFIADTVSYEEITHALEEHFKRPFKRITASQEETLVAVEADKSVRNFPVRLRAMFGGQKGVWMEKKDSWNAQHANHVRLTTFSEYVSTLKSQAAQ